MNSFPIDIVLPWVDCSDPMWQNEYKQYCPETRFEAERFRDWGLLKFLFRGIEKFAPWVNKIFFITNGQMPEWLALDAPKLVFMKHAEYIPSQYLPTFNSNTIEFFYDLIPGLSEHFILFNDDTFITDYVSPSRFFQHGLPCDMVTESAYMAWPSGFNPCYYYNAAFINKCFNKRDVIRQNFSKWFNLKYGAALFQNIYFYGVPFFISFKNYHFPHPFLKRVYKEVHESLGQEIETMTCTRFRSNTNLSQLLVANWQLCTGQFYPYDIRKKSLYIQLTDTNFEQCASIIRNQKYSVLCLNDNESIRDFETGKKLLIDAFLQILPDPSRFERG